MADDKPQGAEADPKSSRKKKLIPIAIVAGLMLLEGGGVFLATRYMTSGPLNSRAGVVQKDGEKKPESQSMEVLIIDDFTAPNRKTGRIFVYEIQVGARIAKVDQEKVEELVKLHRLTVEDKFTNIIRRSTPEVLQEDGLETLRRQFRAELNKVFNDESIIQEILFPRVMSHRADY